MGDAARINLYGVFARFKDSIVATITCIPISAETQSV